MRMIEIQEKLAKQEEKVRLRKIEEAKHKKIKEAERKEKNIRLR